MALPLRVVVHGHGPRVRGAATRAGTAPNVALAVQTSLLQRWVVASTWMEVPQNKTQAADAGETVTWQLLSQPSCLQNYHVKGN